MPAPSAFGTDYSRFFTPVPGEEAWIPFPHPMTEAQRVANARARAKRAGVEIGSGTLNSQSGELQDPDRGFGRAVLSKPGLMVPLVLGGGLGLSALLGPSATGPEIAATTSPLGSVSTPTASALAGPSTSAALGGVAPAAASATPGILNRLRDSLLSPEGLATAGSIAASLAMRGDGTNADTRASEEQARRLQAITEARMRRVDPLHEAVTQLAFGRLPIASRQGVNLPRIALPE